MEMLLHHSLRHSPVSEMTGIFSDYDPAFCRCHKEPRDTGTNTEQQRRLTVRLTDAIPSTYTFKDCLLALVICRSTFLLQDDNNMN